MGHNAFVPISLASPFYTRDVIRYLWSMYLVHYSSALFVPCDGLRYLTYEGRGEQHPERLVEQQVQDTQNLIRSVVEGLQRTRSLPSYEIKLLSEIATTTGFQQTVGSLCDIIASRDSVSLEFKKYCKFWARKMFGRTSKRIMNIQNKYIIEETALSIYVTEFLGYTDEFYAKGDQMFVNWMYKNVPNDLQNMLKGAQPKREFIELGAMPRWNA